MSRQSLHIHLIGTGNPFIGFGIHTLNTHRQLQNVCKLAGIKYTASDIRNFQNAIETSSKIAEYTDEKEIINLYIGQGKSAKNIFQRLKGRSAIHTVFESNVLADGWKESLETTDLVITASEWGANILRNSLTNTPVEVVPEGIDISQFHHWNRTSAHSTPSSRERKDEFHFLSIGKLEDRKGIKELLAAFSQAFSREKHVKLNLKIHNLLDKNYLQKFQILLPNEISDQVSLAKSNDKKDAMSNTEIADLYRSCHCFVFPSKAEGWGLPLIEAIACGTPFTATHYSGQTEYLQHFKQRYSSIKYCMEKISSEDFFTFHKFTSDTQPQWAKPDIDSLADNMKNIYNNWEKLNQDSIKNSQLARKLFSWRASTETLLDVLLKHFS